MNQENNGQPVAAGQNPPVPYNYQFNRDDEIDLYELFRSLWIKRNTVFAIALCFFALAAAYAYTATKWYKTELSIKEVQSSELYPINNSELVSISPEKALNEVRKRLMSVEHFLKFYMNPSFEALFQEKPEAMTHRQYAYRLFEDSFKIELPTQKDKEAGVDNFVDVSFQFPMGVEGAKVLNVYLLWTDNVYKQELDSEFKTIRQNRLEKNKRKMERILADYKTEVDNKIRKLKENDRIQREKLQDQLEAVKNELMVENKQRMQVLDENISIAKKLGFKKPTTPADANDRSQASSGEVIRAEFSSHDKLPLYFRGYESLEAEKAELEKRSKDSFPSSKIADLERQIALLETNREIERLQSREDPRPYIDAYQALEMENRYLSNLDIDTESAELFYLDVAALPAVAPIKPKKLLIMAMGLILGGMIGVMYVLIATAIKKRRKEELSAQN